MVLSSIGLVFYIFSFVFSLTVLKVEKKGQQKAYRILEENNLVTAQELKDIKKLFRLYNIQYVNDTILAFLEIIYQVLQIISAVQDGEFNMSAE